MNKKLKWGLVALALIALAGWGVYSQLPKTNEDLAAADKIVKTTSRKSTLNVNAIVVKPQTISDEIFISSKFILFFNKKYLLLSILNNSLFLFISSSLITIIFDDF